eukprot:m.87462 g.87462  ORF g.87462 m.87462 type:complete len:82 (-) comp11561_c0_seq2:146-391(-)
MVSLTSATVIQSQSQGGQTANQNPISFGIFVPLSSDQAPARRNGTLFHYGINHRGCTRRVAAAVLAQTADSGWSGKTTFVT